MKVLIRSLLIAALASRAEAGGTISFDTPTYCSTYCNGYTTYSSAHTVNYVIDAGQITVGLDGVAYSGPGVEVPITPTTIDPYYATITGAVLTNNLGQSITFNAVVHVKRTAVSSGRAHYIVVRHNVYSGTITMP
jgi:hypothetical protein